MQQSFMQNTQLPPQTLPILIIIFLLANFFYSICFYYIIFSNFCANLEAISNRKQCHKWQKSNNRVDFYCKTRCSKQYSSVRVANWNKKNWHSFLYAKKGDKIVITASECASWSHRCVPHWILLTSIFFYS